MNAKVMWLLLVIPSMGWGAVTQQQVDQAKDANDKMLACYLSMNTYLANVAYLFKSNFKVSVPGSTTTITIPQALQDEAIDVPKYTTKKNCFVDAFNQLP